MTSFSFKMRHFDTSPPLPEQLGDLIGVGSLPLLIGLWTLNNAVMEENESSRSFNDNFIPEGSTCTTRRH
jgi:hypothetical protein